MDKFYQDMDARAATVQQQQDKELEEKWRAAVEKYAAKGRPVRNVQCNVQFQPRREVLDRLQSKTVKLAAMWSPPTNDVDAVGRVTQKCGYYTIYVIDNRWFSLNPDDSKR
jgi:hypothetical protein